MTILRVGSTSKLHLKRQRVIVNDLMHKNYVYLLTEPGEAEAIMLGPAGMYAHAVSREAIKRANGRYILNITTLD